MYPHKSVLDRDLLYAMDGKHVGYQATTRRAHSYFVVISNKLSYYVCGNKLFNLGNGLEGTILFKVNLCWSQFVLCKMMIGQVSLHKTLN